MTISHHLVGSNDKSNIFVIRDRRETSIPIKLLKFPNAGVRHLSFKRAQSPEIMAAKQGSERWEIAPYLVPVSSGECFHGWPIAYRPSSDSAEPYFPLETNLSGFSFKWGVRCIVEVSVKPIAEEDLMEDGPSVDYALVKLIESTPETGQYTIPIPNRVRFIGWSDLFPVTHSSEKNYTHSSSKLNFKCHDPAVRATLGTALRDSG